MDGTFLGKIENVWFGDWDGNIGFHFTLKSTGGSVCDTWSFPSINHNECCQWTEIDRINSLGQIVMRVNKLLASAKRSNLDDLKDTPIEVLFEKRTLKSWRILEEVI
jgi:hypothetical protein